MVYPYWLLQGYEFLQDFNINYPKIKKGVHFEEIDYSITHVRNERGIYLKTSRANPGKDIKTIQDIKDSEKVKKLNNILDAFEYLKMGFDIDWSDDTLKTANYLNLLGFPVIHIPKTIDNDYYGIPWTFGYWTAVDTAQKSILKLKADAHVNR
jgi:6-phosphofructokinase 1